MYQCQYSILFNLSHIILLPILHLLFLLFHKQSSCQPVKKVHHYSHRTNVFLEFYNCFYFGFLFSLYFVFFQSFQVFFLLWFWNAEWNHESFWYFDKLYWWFEQCWLLWNVNLDWVKLGIFFWSFVHFYESFMLINKLIDFIKVNSVSLIFCYHANYQVKKFLHWNWKSRFYVGRNTKLAFSKQCHILLVVIVLLKNIRMTFCDHLEKNNSQWKNITFGICIIIGFCELL